MQIMLTIPLTRPEDLFASPQVTPFDASYHLLSGIEQVVTALQGKNLQDDLHVFFTLPQPAPEMPLYADAKAAIAHYCDVNIAIIQAEMSERRQMTNKNLMSGVWILAASLGLAASLEHSTILSDHLRNLLSNSISILGSVALWSPADALLFGLRPLRKRIRIYKAIKGMTFEFKSAG